MKAKLRTFLKLFLFCVLGIFVCYGIFQFTDNVLNGAFLDWFEKNYMIEYDSSYLGTTVIVHEPAWSRLKPLICTLVCGGIVCIVTLLFLVSRLYANYQVKQTVSEISQEIQESMRNEENSFAAFPKEHAEISAQITSIKAEMQRHEQILKDESARKNDLITYLAHDLKTPLTSVIGYLSLLEEAPDMPDMQKSRYISIALDKSQRLEKLVNEFFEITRYNLQHVQLEKETIDLYYMLVQMTDEFYPLLMAHGNTARLLADEALTVYGDADKLARVFHNLLKNAIAYSYRDTAIEIQAETIENEVKIYFRNKGKTIPQQKLDTVFEKFFRLDESRSSDTGGAGLGLAIAKDIVSLHGGTISAQSEKEVTTFCVTLPAEM